MKSVTRTKKKKAYKIAFGLGCQGHSWDLHNAVRVLKMKGRVDCAICLQVLASRWWVDTAPGGVLERWCLRQPQTFLPTSSLSVGRDFVHFSLTPWHHAFRQPWSPRWSVAVSAADSAFPWTLFTSGWVSEWFPSSPHWRQHRNCYCVLPMCHCAKRKKFLFPLYPSLAE